MIKQLRKYDVQNTPFIATKSWNLLNTNHQDLLETEDGLFTIALEFISFQQDVPQGIINFDCDIALEQQGADPVVFQEGISGSGFLHPTDDQNLDGTFKRLIWHQIFRAFYNTSHNPLETFGLNKIDFQTSGLQRFLGANFKVFKLPQINFGDKIAEGTMTFVDNAFDDNYVIADDGLGNLLAGPNLFSKSQEIRHFENVVFTGSFDSFCPPPILGPPPPPTLSGEDIDATSSFLHWTDVTSSFGYYIYRSDDGGSSYNQVGSTTEPDTSSIDAGLIPATTYYYKITSYNPLGVSAFSNIVQITTNGNGLLFTTPGVLYTLGPYDMFDEYGPGTQPSGGGFGWTSGWDIRTPKSPDLVVSLAVDTMDTYTSGSVASGSSGGGGWITPWS
jgi:hypothetical protein